MGGAPPPGSLGMNPRFAGESIPEEDTSDPIGMGGAPVQEITASKKNWDKSKPVTKPAPTVKGKTVEAVRTSLSKLTPEWGRGGGSMSVSLESNGDGTVTAVVTAKLYRILPNWVDKDKADAESKALWSKMIKRLEKHEQRHMEIAAEAAEWLADTLVGLNTDEIQETQNDAVEIMQNDHRDLDDDSEHGTDPEHEYGGVVF